MARRRRRCVRLPAKAYRTRGQIFSITICTLQRRPVFDNLLFGRLCVAELRRISEECQIPVLAYCLMPDHAHLLLAAGDRTSLITFVGKWKSKCYRHRLAFGCRHPFWQRSFWDHALRRNEQLPKVAQYIVNNPVRAGLVTCAGDYPLSGSFAFDL